MKNAWIMLLLLGPAAVASVSRVQAAIDCPAPSRNVDKNIVVDTQGAVNGLGKLVAGDIKNRVEITVTNLFEKYPNADRLAIATSMMSEFCQLIDHSSLSDREKLDQLQETNKQIIELMTKVTTK